MSFEWPYGIITECGTVTVYVGIRKFGLANTYASYYADII